MNSTNVTRRGFLKHVTAISVAAESLPLVAAANPKAASPKPRIKSMRWSRRLDGLWKFQPEQALDPDARPQDPSLRDDAWPEIDVPNFWRPNEYWLWQPTSGASEDYLRSELERVGRYKFDAYATRAGWYRKWVNLPAGVEGQRVFLRFWAVAQVAQVWWNGEPIGSHLGMFGPFVCEATKIRPGRNLLTVFVSSGCLAERADVALLKSRGVTVDVTSPWLDNLPQSVYWMCGSKGGGGIWQSVDIWISNAVTLEDVFFRPQLDGGSLEISVDNGHDRQAERTLRFSINDPRTGALLTREAQPVQVQVPARGRQTVTIEIPKVSPKLWSPGNPHLYNLRVELWEGAAKRDEYCHVIGFRTMRVQGTQFRLNDKPYYLRGAAQSPYGLAPWSRDLAMRYLGLMRDGNQLVSMFNETGGNDVWCDAADEIGIGMIDQGAWSWGLTDISNSDSPPPELVEAWRNMHAEQVRSVRNHPSILLRSINDEMWFHYLPARAMTTPADEGGFIDPDEHHRLGKWKILSDVIRLTRKLDDTRPINASGGYARSAEEWKQLEPLGIDDGDYDSIHVFNGTYGPSYLALDVHRDIEQRYGMGTRPLMSDQAGTGYPDNDIGFPTTNYVTNEMVPQAWVGRFIYDGRMAYQDIDGQIIKDGYERIRCRKTRIAGWLIFSNSQWFQHVYDANRIKTYPKIYDGVTLALSPILIALDTPARRFTAGDKVPLRFVAVHDDLSRNRLENLRVVWTWMDGSRQLGRGEAKMPALEYYEKVAAAVTASIPELPGQTICRGNLVVELYSGSERLSHNRYSTLIAANGWYRAEQGEKIPIVLVGRDPAWADALREINVSFTTTEAADWAALSVEQPVIVSDTAAWQGNLQPLKDFVNRGGRILFHDPTAAVANQLGFHCEPIDEHFGNMPWDQPAGPWGAEYMDISTVHPLAIGLDPVYDMRWWNPQADVTPSVSTKVLSTPDRQSGSISILNNQATLICTYVAPHGYYHSPFDFEKLFLRSVIAEITLGQGRIIAGCFRLAPDPVARKFLLNFMRYLHRQAAYTPPSGVSW